MFGCLRGRIASTLILSLSFGTAALIFAPHAQAQRYKIIYTFQGGTDGALPETNLLPDGAGGFYGTTYGGGGTTTCVYQASCGTVFHLSPPAGSGGSWTETVLYRFGGSPDAGGPTGALVRDAAGNLYGSTYFGGTANVGTVYELSPPAQAGGSWTETILYSFPWGTADGAYPMGGLSWGPGKALYGITEYGGFYNTDCYNVGCGTVFQLSPPAQAGGNWTEAVVHEFTPAPFINGALTNVTLVSRNGALYGVTPQLGLYYQGSVFKLSLQGGSWLYQDLYYFSTSQNPGSSYYPYGGVVFDNAGNIYGTTGAGGPSNSGSVYELTEPGLSLNTLYSFAGSPNDGSIAKANLTMDPAGNLYGTTGYGGTESPRLCRAYGCGVVFKLSNSSGTWSETVLHTFASGNDGANPFSPVYVHNGVVYGTTFYGGASGVGIVYQIIP